MKVVAQVEERAIKAYSKGDKETTDLKKDNTDIIREVGERVDITCTIEPNSVKDVSEGVFEAIITTSGLDRHGEYLSSDGINTDAYMKNPIVLYGHDYEGLPIGKTTKLTPFKNKIKAQFQLAVEEYPFAATVAKLIKGGYLNATSIGGIVKKWSEDYTRVLEMEMLEFSVVPVPANGEALITSRSILKDVTGKSVDEIRTEYEDFARSILLDKVKGMPHDELNDAISVMEKLLARLKETAAVPSLPDEKPLKRIKNLVLEDARAVASQSQRVIKVIKINL